MSQKSILNINGCELAVHTFGEREPGILALHGGNGPFHNAPFLDTLAANQRVIVPSHPGFGESSRPRHIRTIQDLAYLYLDLIDALDLRGITLMGFSIGGWIAAEIAIRSTERIGRLIMVDSVGVKLGDRETRDFPDLFATPPEELARLAFHDPSKAAIDFDAMSEADLVEFFRNRETFALYAWEPYLHNPQLKHWLHRIKIPALFLWGASDGLVNPDYGRAYAQLLPDAEFDLIVEAGHAPHIEQPDHFTDRVQKFLDRTGPTEPTQRIYPSHKPNTPR